ncbi:hypothetical protein A2454_06105 [Candidatus Peribacteria bacterium RIFOXYC2_FULL_55_14]|nr:MAG: hypothetical protein A2198_03460 [Candidatus Peribacteria bacterium RIFOXYA1_FULL_56_14]OGJ72736.1 MAG: hypothetical protein A2217_04600 [Candidatus Peribacteria bacterium RIFOXYA2_FULL_55_28]OGJ75359.1 MAG: hypothetical protein A2384_00455 [Candidatus Peribacteria bacterium RIFOXYB1_FULL_54_35]OGJ76464.1 MAG: hypothetical protein A2327_01415 [Candidatus Peribacteria bacterium RIFOXYB2_FULL_54_17]OGJ79481.1 MAG: hypothetical protein A2424_01650 [Candidatus Peribacteria bacterium RIFOXYC
MTISEALDPSSWDAFLAVQQFRPFLQSWTMGEVYRSTGQEPLRLEARSGNEIEGICQAITVPARRGRHLSVPYGPLLKRGEALEPLLAELCRYAKEQRCLFVRISPFWTKNQSIPGSKPSPLHLLAEHLWYLPLTQPDVWQGQKENDGSKQRKEEELFMQLRKTTRNLVRRAEREGVTVEASRDPLRDLPLFLALHEETRKRHHFTPYTDAFFRAQVGLFAPRSECTLYLARYGNEVIASSIHMHMAGETSYHHGASTDKYGKIPASYLLQWTAIADALRRSDHIYNFWGIAPEGAKRHPFRGVTLFKTGFGGKMLELTHCMDVPLSPLYHATRAFEYVRKWRRGF